MKQTEIGLIPDDWEVKRLGDVTRIQAGGTPSTLFEAYWNGNIRWMNSGELNLKRVYEVEGRITELGLNNSSTHLIPKGCVLIGLAGQGKTRGTAAINYVDLCTNQSIAAIFPSNFHNSDFLYHVMDNKYQELRELSDGGGGRGGLNLKILNDIQIPLPPLPEQQRIAKALSDVDALIFTTEKLLQKKKNIKQGTMQELLTGKKRLPGFAKSNNTKMTELGEIPEDWEVKTLNELINDISDGPFGSNLKTEHYTTEREVRIIQLSNVGEDGWDNENVKYTTFTHAKEIQRCIVPYGSIVIAKMMPAGRAILCPNKEKMYILGSDCVRISPNNLLDSLFFMYFSKTSIYLNQIKENTQGSTRARTSVSKLKRIEIALPPKKEQNSIAKILSDMDNEIDLLNTKLEKYRNLKNAMMQQLLTGKIRLVK